ncbi:protein of unknown function [Taphrina deformans PYCC 5710]|uniref:GAF domain-containing protein n=1 Tax=Taphrina deformans (strain PYCC 5710 / ATCC 11124 / CBS 356.35 / IMI 108563 / JCM 9778 / NBRC 8474) TaxID=1097556 RepID=R4XHE8_TAPDE|nr:protein of unknown function [Taphrina deformans PYCC 5710]|eukprot:CCG85109.1 protein of unknown function [Taphrina deformans PYCC 5710]
MSSGLVLPVDDSYKAALALGTPEEWIKTSEAGPEPRAGERTSRLSSSVRADKTFGDTLVVGYRFLHDKVQQAVYALIDERDRPSIQLQTGSRLLEAFGDDVRDSMLFDICSQINKGRSLLPRREYLRLAKLNLRAAQTAFQNTASETALQFLCQTRDYFPENIWHIDAPMVEQYYELTENVYASMTLYEEAIKASTTIFENSTNLVVKTRMHGRQVKAYMSLGRAAEAIATGCAGLTAAGIPFEKYLDGSLSDSDIDDAVISLWAALPSSATAIHSLNTLPIIEDELMLAGSEILMIFLPPLYLSNPALAPLLVLTGVMTSIKKGIASYTCYFMYFLAMLLCEIDDPHCDFELAAAWNQTSEVLLDELMRSSPRYLEHAGSSLTLSGCVYAFTRDARVESLRAFNLSIELSQRCFDGQYMAYSVGNQANTRLFCGENLMQILNELVKHVNLVRSYKQTPGMLYCLPTLQVIHNLVHSSNRQKALEMSGTLVADLTKSLELLETGDSLLLHSVYFWTARLLLCLVLQDHEGAILAVLGGRKMLHGAYGVATKLYFETMALVVLLEHKDRGLKMPPELADYLPILCNHIEGWAKQNSRNYGCWKFFMLAETKKSAQGLEATLNAYERAIEAAVESKNYLLEAIFNERCAKYLKNSGLGQKIAAGYIEAAIQAYQSWGSPVSASHCASVYGASDLHRSETDSNVSSFEARLRTSSYGNVSRNIAGHVSVTSMMSDLSSPSPSADSTGSTAMMSRLMSIQEDYSTETDLSVVIQSSLLLTRTLGTAELVKQLLKLLVQVAGAQHGALVIDLQQDQNLCVAATTELAGVQLYDDLPLDAAGDLVPIQLIRLAANSRRCIIDEARFVRQPYQRSGKQEHSLGAAKSFMALPVLLRDKILAVAYLSNNQISNLFTSRKVELLTILASQAAITLEKARSITTYASELMILF